MFSQQESRSTRRAAGRAGVRAGAAVAGAMLAFYAVPASAACNSGNTGNLLTGPTCQATAAGGFAALAVGASSDASGSDSTAIGGDNTASNQSTVAVGTGNTASGPSAIAIGGASVAEGRSAIAIGSVAGARGAYSIAMGETAGQIGGSASSIGYIAIGAKTEVGLQSIAIGSGGPTFSGARSQGSYSIAIGGGDASAGVPATASHAFGIAMGTGSVARLRSAAIGAFAGAGSAAGNHRNVAVGEASGQTVTGAGNSAFGVLAGGTVAGNQNTALGNSAGQSVTGNNNTAVGASAGSGISVSNTVALGASSLASRRSSVAIGAFAQASGLNATAIGGGTVAANSARATGNYSVALGSSRAGGESSVALGDFAYAAAGGSVALGSGSVASAINTVSVGRAGERRRIVNVAPAVNTYDAVTLGQVQALIAGASLSEATVAQSAGQAAGGGTVGAPGRAPTLAAAVIAHAGNASRPQAAAPSSDAAAAGPTGELQPSAIVGWANIEADGTIAGGRNTIAAVRQAQGDYEVTFTRASLRNCTYNVELATIGFTAVRAGESTNSVRVETRNHHGARMDAAFYLMAVC